VEAVEDFPGVDLPVEGISVERVDSVAAAGEVPSREAVVGEVVTVFQVAESQAAGIGRPIDPAWSPVASPRQNKCSPVPSPAGNPVVNPGKAMGSKPSKADKATEIKPSKAGKAMGNNRRNPGKAMGSRLNKADRAGQMTTTILGITAMVMAAHTRPGPLPVWQWVAS
jgi:hypothetical protein